MPTTTWPPSVLRASGCGAAANGRFDVAYGPHEDELLDIYLADDAGPAPIVVFFHGGRWARGSKASNCEGAETYTALGVHFVSVNFSLLPTVTMDVLIHQCRDAIAWLWRNAETSSRRAPMSAP